MGERLSETNVRRRVLAPAVERASAALEARGDEPPPTGLAPHSRRRTFASILVALGEDTAYVIGQLGHTDPALTLGSTLARWGAGTASERLHAPTAPIGHQRGLETPGRPTRRRSHHVRSDEAPALAGASGGVSDGARTRDRLDHNQELYQLSYAHHARDATTET